MPKEVDYGAKIVKLKDAIAALRDNSINAEAKNKLIKAIIQRIEYEYITREGRGQTKFRLHIQLLL